MEEESRMDEKANVCPICDRAFVAKKALAQHVRTFHGIKKVREDPTFDCPVCDRAYSTKKGMAQHVRIFHGIKKEPEENLAFDCTVCHRAFSTKKGLTIHSKLFHGIERVPESFACQFCDKSFAVRTRLNRHVASLHQRNRRFLCDKCPYISWWKDNILRHLKTEHNVVVDSSAHIRVVDVDEAESSQPDIYECVECEYSNRERRKVVAHLVVDHGISRKVAPSHLRVGKGVSAPQILAKETEGDGDECKGKDLKGAKGDGDECKGNNLKGTKDDGKENDNLNKFLFALHLKRADCIRPKRISRKVAHLHLRVGKGVSTPEIRTKETEDESKGKDLKGAEEDGYESKENLLKLADSIRPKRIFKCAKCPWSSRWMRSIYRHLRKAHHICELFGLHFNVVEVGVGSAASSVSIVPEDRVEEVDVKREKMEEGNGDTICPKTSARYEKRVATRSAFAEWREMRRLVRIKERSSENGEEHMNEPLETFGHYCQYCSQYFVTPSELTRHVNAMHTKALVYQCVKCPHNTSWKHSLNKHLKVKHQVAPSGYSANTKVTRKMKKGVGIQELSAENGEERTSGPLKKPRFPCSYCAKITKGAAHLWAHTNAIHTKNVRFQCKECQYSSLWQGRITGHLRDAHHIKDNYSSYYGKIEDLTKSEVVTEPETFNQQCQYCSQYVATPSALAKHINAMHTKSLVYQCVKCPYKARWKHTLTTHLKSKHHVNPSSYSTYIKVVSSIEVKNANTEETTDVENEKEGIEIKAGEIADTLSEDNSPEEANEKWVFEIKAENIADVRSENSSLGENEKGVIEKKAEEMVFEIKAENIADVMSENNFPEKNEKEGIEIKREEIADMMSEDKVKIKKQKCVFFFLPE